MFLRDNYYREYTNVFLFHKPGGYNVEVQRPYNAPAYFHRIDENHVADIKQLRENRKNCAGLTDTTRQAVRMRLNYLIRKSADFEFLGASIGHFKAGNLFDTYCILHRKHPKQPVVDLWIGGKHWRRTFLINDPMATPLANLTIVSGEPEALTLEQSL